MRIASYSDTILVNATHQVISLLLLNYDFLVLNDNEGIVLFYELSEYLASLAFIVDI